MKRLLFFLFLLPLFAVGQDTYFAPKQVGGAIGEKVLAAGPNGRGLWVDNTLPTYYDVRKSGGDATGVNEVSTQVNAAISAGRRVIYFSRGRYKLVLSILMRDSLTVFGDGASTIITIAVDTPMFRGSNVIGGRFATIHDLTLVGSSAVYRPAAPTAQDGVSITALYGVNVYNVHAFNLKGYAVHAQQVYPGYYITFGVMGNRFSNLFVQTSYGGAFIDAQAEYLTIQNCNFNANTVGVRSKAGNSYIVSNSISNNLLGIWLTGGANDGHGLAASNMVNHCDTIVKVDGVAQNFTFEGNYLYVGNIYVNNSPNISFIGGAMRINDASNQPQTITWSNSPGGFFSGVRNDVLHYWSITGPAPVIIEPTTSGIDVMNGSVNSLRNVKAADTLFASRFFYNNGTELLPGSGSGSQINSDWNATSGVAQILNKPAIASGTYTPAVSGAGTTATAFPCHYQRIGSEVTVTGAVGSNITGGFGTTSISFSLPVASANFTSPEQALGLANVSAGAAQGSGAVTAVAGSQTATVAWTSTTTGSATVFFTFTYTIQ